MQTHRPFLAMLICSAAVLLAASCNGNAGGSDSYGAIYSPGGSSPSQTKSGGTISAIDILNYSNADDMDTVVAILLGGGEVTDETQTQTITLNAADIGLPSGGTVTLTIQGSGVDISVSATADADGTVTFEIPAIATGSEITVSLSVRNATGTLLYNGSRTERLVGDSLTINLPLRRQFWTLLPGSISLTASPDGFVYDNTKLNETTTLSISGLEDAPAGAALSYSWELGSSPLPDSGPTLTRTWNELIGPTAPSGELTKTFTVTVSYTDEAGEAKTASASTDVIIGPPVTIPNFTVQITAYGKNGENSSGTNYAFYSTYGGSFTFKVVEAESYFPAGTSFSWSISKTGGDTYEFTGMSVTKTLENLGLTTAGVNASWTVTCTASNARAAAPVTGGGDSAMSGRALKLPKFHLNVTPVNHNTANSSDSTSTYAFIGASGEKFTITPELDSGETAVTGMKYYWTVEGTSISSAEGASGDGHIDVDVSDLSGFSGTTSISPGSWNVGCTLKYTGFSNETASTTLSAFMLKIPDFTISISAGAGLNQSLASTASKKVFVVSTSGDLSKTIKLVATKKTGEPDFPTGTTFTWTTDTGAPISDTPALTSFCAVPPADSTEFTVKCTAQFTGLADVGPKEANFALKKPVKLNPPTPSRPEVRFTNNANTATRNASGSAASGYTVTVENHTLVSNIYIEFHWSAADSQPALAEGKTVKYRIYKSSGALVGSANGTESSYYSLSALGGSIGNPCTIKLTSYIEGSSDPQESDPVTFTLTVNYE